MSSNINNLNIFTFIKDIYQSLKHIDKCFNDFNTNINLRLSKIEDNQLILTNKLSEIEIILQKTNDINTSNIGINNNNNITIMVIMYFNFLDMVIVDSMYKKRY